MDGLAQENLIRLALVNEHGLFRDSLSRYLASEPGFQIAGECGTPDEALELLRHSAVDIVLVDFESDWTRSSDFIRMAAQIGYTGKFLLIASSADARPAAVALKLGASGVFLKSEALSRLVQAIRMVADGQIWVDPKIIRMLADGLVDGEPQLEREPQAIHLQDRERHVLSGIMGGLTNKKIAAGMALSESTIKNIVQRLFNKAGVNTRSQLVRAALEGNKKDGWILPTAGSKTPG